MIIDSSTITMKSERSFYSHMEQKQASMVMNSDEAATLTFSEESKSLVEQLNEYREEKNQQAKQNQKEQARSMAMAVAETAKANQGAGIPVQTEEDIQIQTLKRILAMLNARVKGGKFKDLLKAQEEINKQVNGLQGNSGCANPSPVAGAAATVQGISLAQNPNVSRLNGGASISIPSFKKVTVTSAFYTEAEHTAFQSQGLVHTKDGRTLTFDVQVEMSRAFCEKYDSIAMEDYICVDPLVFNLDGNVNSISDQKFLFDLNADGTEEEISFTNQGSGFLALDKNGDGKINDGSELFGTQSGDGFADLAVYDEDGNGWIDEADDVFKDLTIWTLNAEGEKVQISLADADVGAIYLGNASTEFSMKNETDHATNGIVRSTGIFLKESGGAGTVQHIDLAV